MSDEQTHGFIREQDGRIILDENHFVVPTSDPSGRPFGFREMHRPGGDGTPWCGGFVFRADADPEYIASDQAPRWDVLSEEPLTLSPSVLCRTCGEHGFIRDGRWVSA